MSVDVVSAADHRVLLAFLDAFTEQVGGGDRFPNPPTWVDPVVNAETFDPDAYVAGFDDLLLGSSSSYRRAATRHDPLLFALVYFPQHLRSPATGGRVTFADAHLEWCRRAREWAVPTTGPGDSRHAEIAPRECGKSSWWFLIIPLWAAAHKHVAFIAAFAHSTGQAETHLSSIKNELDHNDLLRSDYPDLCTPGRRRSGTTVADRQGMLHQKSGFTFAARGIDAASLGLKVDEHRPDVLLLDDIEPDESQYSADQASKRLRTLIDAVLPMNLWARVVLIGTVVMTGSIVHQLVRAAAGDPPDWVVDERFTAHHIQPIITRDDGSERSVWPAKWPLGMLAEIRHTRSYKKNFANDPMGADGGYWTDSDFRYEQPAGVTGQVLSVDPTVTTKRTSDLAGVAVIGLVPARAVVDVHGRRRWEPARCVVEDAWELRLVGEALRQHLIGILARHPLVRVILVESNQGGENWHSILHHMPVPVRIMHQSAKKEVRAADCLNHYQRGRVVHAKRIPRLEEQMVAFPKAAHDDMVDSVVGCVNRLLAPTKAGQATSEFPR